MNNIPAIKLGLISVSRDCFPIELSAARRHAVAASLLRNRREKFMTALSPWKMNSMPKRLSMMF